MNKEDLNFWKGKELISFNCDVCKKDKKSKTVVYNFKDEGIICNGCYGQILSK